MSTLWPLMPPAAFSWLKYALSTFGMPGKLYAVEPLNGPTAISLTTSPPEVDPALLAFDPFPLELVALLLHAASTTAQAAATAGIRTFIACLAMWHRLHCRLASRVFAHAFASNIGQVP